MEPLQVTRISPTAGDVSGGTRVQVTGSGFTTQTVVKFGDDVAQETTYLGPMSLLATSPPHTRGTVNISVVNVAAPGSLPVTSFAYKRCAGSNSMLLLVLIAGALGGTLHAIRSFFWYVGNRNLKWSWVPMYAFQPLTGATLASIFFLVISGGVAPSPAPSNRLWIVGLAALVGLFSAQGFEKLKKIFEGIFTTVPPAADKPLLATAGTALVITPNLGPQAGGTPVRITGTGFAPGTTVQFGATPSKVFFVDPTNLIAATPSATQPGAVDVAVTVPGSPTITLPKGFTYT